MADHTNGSIPFHPSPADIDAAIQKAMQEAVVSHALAGRPVAVWREGQVAWVQPADVLRKFPQHQQTD